MAQAKSNVEMSRPNVAVNIIDNTPRKLPENVTIEERADGSVVRVETFPDTGRPGPDRSESRVDTALDRDLILKGGKPWYIKFMIPYVSPEDEAKAKAKAEAKAKPKADKKAKKDAKPKSEKKVAPKVETKESTND